MAKFLFYLVLVVALLGGTFRLSLESPGIQNAVTEQIAWVAMKRRAEGLPNPDSLRLFMCGTASPLGNSDRAQACVAVLTPHHFYIVDSGAGSTARLTAAGLPVERMQAVLLTHFHSDHIAELYELNLVSWVAGRPEPLKIYGPRGVRNVVRGVNETYEMDRQYRMAHHGIDILPEHLGELSHQFLEANTILEDGDLTITAWQTHHDPASPALGYRFDFRGRSVVISGDSTVTDDTRRVTKGVDLLLHDALSKPLMTGMVKAAEAAGLKRRAKNHGGCDGLPCFNRLDHRPG